ncbi:hypothetical protein MYCTH_2093591 [Thermothelomyces thermophilus ATCC 42464]|uniref:Uncharacterized protein n=1 Tax=Thermothelomyces thermophilus (strain ATCC 42464 / BCRC 31852 / DSM 1799) TaxID=573729 RepID=G2QH26_THET4|nr:uncharacterized protein MYCTH_2093591 [Thermothelomyces thermophilus ATCC 42464]AEO58686.1 hypothetical protein MYCTH_2093591 [Thermothelomyces thermophilus ATCC 42464]
MTASRIAQLMAPFLAALYPPRIANEPPVKNPAIWSSRSWSTYASSFFLMPLTAQSNVLNKPPQTPKLPPKTGARILIAVMAPSLRSPYGLFLNPLTPCQIVPPTAYWETHTPMQKAPPKSLRMTQGQGSRV